MPGLTLLLSVPSVVETDCFLVVFSYYALLMLEPVEKRVSLSEKIEAEIPASQVAKILSFRN